MPITDPIAEVSSGQTIQASQLNVYYSLLKGVSQSGIILTRTRSNPATFDQNPLRLDATAGSAANEGGGIVFGKPSSMSPAGTAIDLLVRNWRNRIVVSRSDVGFTGDTFRIEPNGRAHGPVGDYYLGGRQAIGASLRYELATAPISGIRQAESRSIPVSLSTFGASDVLSGVFGGVLRSSATGRASVFFSALTYNLATAQVFCDYLEDQSFSGTLYVFVLGYSI
jgi:hypothetical protein